jgi:UDP-N-acetylglucosamine 2-epimerase (non-hydrolysing)
VRPPGVDSLGVTLETTQSLPAEAASAPPGAQIPVIVVVGTRPEAIKLVPIILALRASQVYRPVIVSTGQHHEMVAKIFEVADIQTDAELWIGNARSRLNERVATVMQRFEDFCCGVYGDHEGAVATSDEVLCGQYPAAVLVHGDTSSAFAAALSAFHLRIPVVHIEAGLRTGGLNSSPFPEELNRQLVSCIASFHCAPTAVNQENLVRENIPVGQIFVTGNTGIDALHWAAGLDLPFADPEVADAVASDDRLVVVTAHRRESWGGGLGRIAAGVAAVASTHPDVRFVVPLHPNPRVRAEIAPVLEPLANVVLTEPLDYIPFARLLRRCELAITDSGGIQEEAPSLGKPVLVTRETTERGEGVQAGTLRLVGTDPALIQTEASRLLDEPAAYAEMAEARNPYGDGRAAERIVAALEQIEHGGQAPAPFGPGYTRDAVLAAAGYQAAREVAPHNRPRQAVEAEPPPPEEPWMP